MNYLSTGKRYPQSKPRLIAQREAAVESGYRVNRSKDAIARNALYSTREWRELRKQVLAEEPTCRFCGAPASHADHLQHGPDWRQHFFDRSNLQALCAPCHNAKSAKDKAKKVSPYEKYRKPQC